MRPRLTALRHSEERMTTVEYALLVGVVALVALTAWQLLAARPATSAAGSPARVGQ